MLFRYFVIALLQDPPTRPFHLVVSTDNQTLEDLIVFHGMLLDQFFQH